MQLLSAEAVDLIRSFRAFLEEESPSACLASPEDADYFRTVARRQKAEGTAEKQAPPQTNLEFKASPALGPAPKTAEPFDGRMKRPANLTLRRRQSFHSPPRS